MKPSTTDIQVKQNKASFIAWLLTEFSENEFTNSEMKNITTKPFLRQLKTLARQQCFRH